MEKKRITTLFIVLITIASVLDAQNRLFTAADYLNRDLQPKGISGLSWRGGLDTFTWIESNALLQKSAASPEKADTVLTLKTLNTKLKAIGLEEMKQFPSVTWMSSEKFRFSAGTGIVSYDVKKGEARLENEYDEKGENITIDEKQLNFAYTIGNNIFVTYGGKTIQVTDEKNTGIVYGQIPSRNEFGINAGLYWSPNGGLLAFYRTDETEVADYPLVDLTGRIAQLSPVKYPMAGMKSQKVSVGIFNPAVNEIVYLQTPGPENQYITSVSWDPSEKYIYAGILNRGQNHLMVCKFDAVSGKHIKNLFEERNERYVEPMQGLQFLKSDPSKFFWQSRRDGWNHLYLYDTEGALIKQVTKGEWEVLNLFDADLKGQWVYYESTAQNPLEKHYYRTDIKTGKTEKLTAGEGVHTANPSGSLNYFIDQFSGISMARAFYLSDSRGTRLQTLKEDTNPYKDFKTGEMSIFSIKAGDGKTDLWCRLIKPVDFDPSRKYPVFIYVYGGPHAQMITKSWTGGAGFFLNWIAQQGYVVFTLDNRGSANRGFEFESIIHRQLGAIEMADQMAGVEYLKTLPWVDQSRIGVNGWSYGGFMTISLMLRNPGVFKAACAGGPVIDWKWYEVMYGERYMDTPMENPEGYEKSSLLKYAGNLDGRLLMIHGTSDPTVVWQNSLVFLDECIKQGKQVDYFVYPGAGHNMTGKARVHLFEKMAGYFNDFLK